MVEENNSFVATKNGHDLLNEASLVAEFFLNSQQQEISIDKIKEQLPFLKTFDVSKITPLFKTFTQPANRNNILLSGMIFYVISKGKYPQDAWADALKGKEETKIFSLKTSFNDYTRTLGNGFVPPNHKSEFNNIIKDFKREQIMPLINEDERVPGLVCLFETIYETFVEKYDKYAPRIFNKLFEQYKNKTFHKREGTECVEQKLNAYSVSFAGNMDKPGHADCEDFSFVKSLDKHDKIFLVAVCDGVGSAIDSETGSKCACEALEKVISNYISRSKKALRKRNGSGTIRNYAILMPMLQYDLATDLYIQWAKLVRNSPSYQQVKKQRPAMDQFTSTMQFALITPLFVCTGKVGDGSFYLRKREKNGRNDLDGIFCLTDGRSDVLEKAVLNMAVLDTNPRSLQINFYRRDEVKDILITSDGVSPLFKDDLLKAYYIMKDLYLLPYENRIKKLEKMAMYGSDVNTVDFSSGGDDASIAYVSFGNEE